MTRSVMNQEDVGVAPGKRARTMGIPSRVEETPPSIPRTVGMVGVCFIVFGFVMSVLNANPRFLMWLFNAAEPILFNPLWIRVWWVVGLVAVLYHAAKDRDLVVRRCYGILAYVLLLLGAVTIALTIGTEWLRPAYGEDTARSAAAFIAAVVGLVTLLFSLVPFVRPEPALQSAEGEVPVAPGLFSRLLTGLKTSNIVQQIAIFGCVLVIAFVLAGFFLTRKYAADVNFLPYGLGSLVLGLVFLLPFAGNETERNWRDAGVYGLGVVGALAGLIGLSSVVTDWLNLENIVLPHGLLFGVIGLVYLWAFIALEGTDSELGYRVAWVVALTGLAVFLLAAGRSLYPLFAEKFRNDYTVPSYLVPSGFLLMFLGAAYATLGASLVSDNRTIVMMRRELAAYFYSPIAYVVIGGISLVAWAGFLMWLGWLNRAAASGRPTPEPIVLGYLLAWMPFLTLVFFAPMITMRLVSEEQRSGTLEVLLTAPVSESSVVVAKFFASWIFFMLAWGTWLVFPLLLRYFGNEPFDYRPLLSFYLILGCMAANFLSMGLFFSSLSRNQIIAFLLAVAGMIVWAAVSFAAWTMESGGSTAKVDWVEILRYMSFLHHLDEFLQGRVHLKHVVFHLSVSVFWLYLAMKVLEARKWR